MEDQGPQPSKRRRTAPVEAADSMPEAAGGGKPRRRSRQDAVYSEGERPPKRRAPADPEPSQWVRAEGAAGSGDPLGSAFAKAKAKAKGRAAARLPP